LRCRCRGRRGGGRRCRLGRHGRPSGGGDDRSCRRCRGRRGSGGRRERDLRRRWQAWRARRLCRVERGRCVGLLHRDRRGMLILFSSRTGRWLRRHLRFAALLGDERISREGGLLNQGGVRAIRWRLEPRVTAASGSEHDGQRQRRRARPRCSPGMGANPADEPTPRSSSRIRTPGAVPGARNQRLRASVSRGA